MKYLIAALALTAGLFVTTGTALAQHHGGGHHGGGHYGGSYHGGYYSQGYAHSGYGHYTPRLCRNCFLFREGDR